MNKRARYIVVAVIALLVSIGISPLTSYVALGQSGSSLEKQIHELTLIEPYVNYYDVDGNLITSPDPDRSGYRTQVLDVEAALAAGIGRQTTELASEISCLSERDS